MARVEGGKLGAGIHLQGTNQVPRTHLFTIQGLHPQDLTRKSQEVMLLRGCSMESKLTEKVSSYFVVVVVVVVFIVLSDTLALSLPIYLLLVFLLYEM